MIRLVFKLALTAILIAIASIGSDAAPKVFYISFSTGSDTNNGTSATTPWKTINKVRGTKFSSGTTICFYGGDTWTSTGTSGTASAELDLSGTNVNGTHTYPVTFGACAGFGTAGAAPIINANNVSNYCIDDVNDADTLPYVTIQGFECKGAVKQGIAFLTNAGKMPGISIVNNYVHNSGNGCSGTTTACVGTDPGGSIKLDQISFVDDNASIYSALNSPQIVGNTVKWVGGHGCIGLDNATGSSVISGNTVGPGCPTTSIDVDSVGGASAKVAVQNNRIDGGQPSLAGSVTSVALGFENEINPLSNVQWSGNVIWNVYSAINICPGGTITTRPTGASLGIYNNTFYGLANSGAVPLVDLNGATCNGPNGDAYTPATLAIENNIFDGGSSTAPGTLTIDNSGGYGACNENFNDIGGKQGNKGYIGCGGSTTLAPNDLNGVDPLYVNAAAFIFDLQITPVASPLFNAGDPSATGNPNIGAYAGSAVPSPTPSFTPTPGPSTIPSPTPTPTPSGTPGVDATFRDLRNSRALALTGRSKAGDYINNVNVNTDISPLAYGAVCDGATDDSAAFTAAMNKVNAIAGTLKLPNAKCLVNVTLTLSMENASIVGVGDEASQLLTTNAGMVQVEADASDFTLKGFRLWRSIAGASGGYGINVPCTGFCKGPKIQDIRVDNAYVGVLLGNASFGVVTNLQVVGSTADGVSMVSTVAKPLQWELRNVLSEINGGSGFHVVTLGGGVTNLAPWDHPYTFGNKQYGIYIQGNSTWPIWDVMISGWTSSIDCLDGALFDSGGFNMQVNNSFIELTGWPGPLGCTPVPGSGNGILVTPNGNDAASFNNNIIENVKVNGFYDQSGGNVVWGNNLIRGSGAEGFAMTGVGTLNITGGFSNGNAGYGADLLAGNTYQHGLICANNGVGPRFGIPFSNTGGNC